MSIKIRAVLIFLTLALLFLPACNGKSVSLPPMITYTDDIFGYSIDYPDNWTTAHPALYQFHATNPVTNTSTKDNDFGVAVSVDNTGYTDDMTLEKYYQNYLTSFKQNSNFTEIKEVSTGAEDFGQNISGYAGTFEITDSAGKWKIRWFITSTRNTYFVIFFYSTLSTYNKNTTILNAVIDSFKFVDITPLPIKKKYSSPPPMAIDINKQYFVTMTTKYGDMVLTLFPADAPQTVNSFIFLTREGFYDDTVFHRVVADFVVQGGDPTAMGTGGPGYYISNEISSRQHVAGTLAMANSGADMNGSQFYICYSAQPTLDGNYTVFGQLVQGIEILYKIKMGDRLIKVTVEEQ